MQYPPHELRGSRKLSTKRVGDLGEEIARKHLIQLGYEILESNYRNQHGEIDLIVQQENTLVFVEVKMRRGTGYGDPLESVTPRKQAQVRTIAEHYLYEREPHYKEMRFDVIGILKTSATPEITHIEDAF